MKKKIKLYGNILLVVILVFLLINSLECFADSKKNVHVNNFSELSSALLNSEVNNISIDSNITFNKDIKHVPSRDISINGGHHSLDIKKFGVFSEESKQEEVIVLKDLKIRGKEDGHPFFNGKGKWQIDNENLIFFGNQLANIPEGDLFFEAKNTLKTNDKHAVVHNLFFKDYSVFSGEIQKKGQATSFEFVGKNKESSILKIGKSSKINLSNVNPINVNKKNQYLFNGDITNFFMEQDSELIVNTSYPFIKIKKVNQQNRNSILLSEGSKLHILNKNNQSLNQNLFDVSSKEGQIVINPNSEVLVFGNTNKALVNVSRKNKLIIDQPKSLYLYNQSEKGNLIMGENSCVVATNIEKIEAKDKEQMNKNIEFYNIQYLKLNYIKKNLANKNIKLRTNALKVQQKFKINKYRQVNFLGEPIIKSKVEENNQQNEKINNYSLRYENKQLKIDYTNASSLEIYIDNKLYDILLVENEPQKKELSIDLETRKTFKQVEVVGKVDNQISGIGKLS